MQRLKNFIKLLTISLTIAGFTVVATAPTLVVTASADDSKAEACNGLSQLNGGETCDNGGQSTIAQLVSLVVNILSWVVGIIAVIAIIVSGFKYVTSGGDSGNISSAKNTLIYALVGILIVAFAQLLVHFALNEGTSAVNGTCSTNSALPADCKS